MQCDVRFDTIKTWQDFIGYILFFSMNIFNIVFFFLSLVLQYEQYKHMNIIYTKAIYSDKYSVSATIVCSIF